MSAIIQALNKGTLSQRLLRADTVWRDANATNDLQLVPVIPTLRGALKSMTARMPQLVERSRKPELKIAWLESCQNTAALKTDVWVRGVPCDFSGWHVGSGNQTVKIKTSIDETFMTPGEVFDSLFTPEELFNRGFLQAQKNVAEKLNRFVIANMATWAGKNLYQKGIGSDGNSALPGMLTKIPYGNLYPQALNNYLSQVQRLNKLINPVLFEGGLLALDERVDNSNFEFNFGRNKVVSDLETFAPLNLSKTMFLVAQGAMALFSVFNYATDAPQRYQGSNFDFFGISRPLLDLRDANGNPIMMDMTYKRIMNPIDAVDFPGVSVTNKCEFVDVFNISINFEHMLNPLGCHNNVTGIIALEADKTLAPIVTPQQINAVLSYPGATPNPVYPTI